MEDNVVANPGPLDGGAIALAQFRRVIRAARFGVGEHEVIVVLERGALEVQLQFPRRADNLSLGVLAAGWFSAMRLTLSHLELVGGFALITTGVATRVVFGHSGNFPGYTQWIASTPDCRGSTVVSANLQLDIATGPPGVFPPLRRIFRRAACAAVAG